MKQQLIYYLNGSFIEADKASIPVMDLGLLRGYGLFDFIRTYNGKPFLIDYHLDNFVNSAQKINLNLPVSKEKLKEVISSLIQKNSFLKEMTLRIVLTGGSTLDSVTPLGKPTLLILVSAQTVYPVDFYEKGISAVTVNISRSLPEIKSTSYLSAIKALSIAKEKNVQEAIYLDVSNNLLEGTRSNLFFIKDKTLITADKNIYLGTTRKLVMFLAKNDLEIIERPVAYEELNSFNECFLTSTSKEIMPVIKIDDCKIGNGLVGIQTMTFMKVFTDFVKGGVWKI